MRSRHASRIMAASGEVCWYLPRKVRLWENLHWEAHLYGFEGRQQLPGRQRSLDGQRSIHKLGLIRHVRRSALIEP